MTFPWQHVNPNIITRAFNRTDTFPKMWEEKRPFSINEYVLQKLDKLEQEIKELKEKVRI